MVRSVFLFSSLILMSVVATPAQARDVDQTELDLKLVAALEAYRGLGVRLEAHEYAAPKVSRGGEGYVDNFAPQTGGHSMNQARRGFEDNQRDYNARPNGASAWQPPSSESSHSACSIKRSGSGAPSSANGVSTGAITPEKLFLSDIVPP